MLLEQLVDPDDIRVADRGEQAALMSETVERAFRPGPLRRADRWRSTGVINRSCVPFSAAGRHHAMLQTDYRSEH